MHRYVAHGLRIDSEIEVGAWMVDEQRASPDVRVVRRAVTRSQSEDVHLIAHAERGDQVTTVVRGDAGIEILFGDAATVLIEPDGVVAVDVTRDEIEPWIVAGAVLAVFLLHRGDLALHATAVSVQGQGVNLVAPMEHGKSSAAALLVAAGAGLVAEDVVRCVPGATPAEPWAALPGGHVIRLRRPISDLEQLFDPASLFVSSDHRALVRCATAPLAVPIAGHLLVQLDPTASHAEVIDVGTAEAMGAVMSSLRVEGLVDRGLLDRQFDLVAGLLGRSWCARLRIPWDGRFDLALAHQVRRAVEERLAM